MEILQNMTTKEIAKEIKTYILDPDTFIPAFIQSMNNYELFGGIPTHLKNRLLIPTINGHVLSIVTIREIAYFYKTDMFQLDRIYKTLLMCAAIANISQSAPIS